MIVRPAPAATVSGSGAVVACIHEQSLALIDTRSGTITAEALPHDCRILALSSNSRFLVVAGRDRLSLLRIDAQPVWQAHADLSGPLNRLVVGADGWVVGVAPHQEKRSSLCQWNGPGLSPVLSADGEDLGAGLVSGLQIDDTAKRAVLWGLEGPSAFQEEGTGFVTLLDLSSLEARRLWRMEGDTVPGYGFLLPLEGGALGAYTRERLSLFAPPAGKDGPWQPTRELQLSNLQQVVASPSGAYLAWRWSEWDGRRDEHHIRVIRLADGIVLSETVFLELGHFPALAVDDSGQVILAYGLQPDRLVIHKAADGKLQEVVSVALDELI